MVGSELAEAFESDFACVYVDVWSRTSGIVVEKASVGWCDASGARPTPVSSATVDPCPSEIPRSACLYVVRYAMCGSISVQRPAVPSKEPELTPSRAPLISRAYVLVAMSAVFTFPQYACPLPVRVRPTTASHSEPSKLA